VSNVSWCWQQSTQRHGRRTLWTIYGMKLLNSTLYFNCLSISQYTSEAEIVYSEVRQCPLNWWTVMSTFALRIGLRHVCGMWWSGGGTRIFPPVLCKVCFLEHERTGTRGRGWSIEELVRRATYRRTFSSLIAQSDDDSVSICFLVKQADACITE